MEMKLLVWVTEIPKVYFMIKESTIYSSEHGPEGGDEANIISLNNNKVLQIANYGWPIYS